MNITQKQKGILFMILSALSFASMQVVVRMSREIPTMEQICVRNLFILIVSFFIIRKKRGSYYGPKKYQPYLFGRSFFGFLGLITLFYASSHAAQGDVTVLNKLSPIFVTLLAAVFMKEKLSPDPDPGAGTVRYRRIHRIPSELPVRPISAGSRAALRHHIRRCVHVSRLL